MQWYQMFEYALGHWLQKSTEHVLGCVLCSPGCFSLFRGEALMSDNVMNTYTTVSTQPKHYIQYDQGEDRWLCTLLLQQGWRVEYSAASGKFLLNTNNACKYLLFIFYQIHLLLVLKVSKNFIINVEGGCHLLLPISLSFWVIINESLRTTMTCQSFTFFIK